MGPSPLLTTPTSKLATPAAIPQPLLQLHTKPSNATASASCRPTGRREAIAVGILTCSSALLLQAAGPPPPVWAASDDEYVKDTSEVITKVRTTINMDKKDPNVATAVSDLRDASNSWVAKYRKEKALLGRPSFRDMYSALNAVSGHYISFGPTSPIPAKRKARILEEMDTAEKALLRGR